MERFWIACAFVVAVAACNPTSLKPGYCHTNKDCTMGKTCNPKTLMCWDMDASSDADAQGDGKDGGDAKDAEVAPPPRCPQTINCADGGYDGSAGVCEPDAGMCVECLEDNDCASKPKTPICEARTCRACKTDAECKSGPSICMTDGHCATTGEVIYVEFNPSGCPGADGSSTKPFCTPNDAVARLADGVNVIVIRGPAADRMTLNTTGFSPVIVGKNNASVPATAATAIQVMSDNVLIRDLTVTGGTAITSKGIVVSGSSTALTLSNVRVNLGMGLGIQAGTGTQFVMKGCTVENNLGMNGMGGGGILLDGGNFTIDNTTVSNNGPGDDSGTTWGGLRIKNVPPTGPKILHLVTVKDNKNTGISCTGGVNGMGVLATGNGGGVEITTGTCGFSSCAMAGADCGSQQ